MRRSILATVLLIFALSFLITACRKESLGSSTIENKPKAGTHYYTYPLGFEPE
jgi:hypothetical protein